MFKSDPICGATVVKDLFFLFSWLSYFLFVFCFDSPSGYPALTVCQGQSQL